MENQWTVFVNQRFCFLKWVSFLKWIVGFIYFGPILTWLLSATLFHCTVFLLQLGVSHFISTTLKLNLFQLNYSLSTNLELQQQNFSKHSPQSCTISQSYLKIKASTTPAVHVRNAFSRHSPQSSPERKVVLILFTTDASCGR